MFKEYDLHRVQSLEEKLEDLDSLSLNYWLTKFVQEASGSGSTVSDFLKNRFLYIESKDRSMVCTSALIFVLSTLTPSRNAIEFQAV